MARRSTAAVLLEEPAASGETPAARPPWLSPVPQIRLIMVRDGATGPRPREQLDSSAKVYNLIRDELEHADRERFVVLAVDGKGRLIGGHEVSVGSLTASLVHPRELFKALFLANAASCILAHNHPSGDPTPSPEDVALTSRLRAAGDLLGVRILDHVIVGEGRYHSMCDAGQL